MIIEKLLEEIVDAKIKVKHARGALEAHQVVLHLFLREHDAERDTADAVKLLRVLLAQLDDAIRPFSDAAIDRATKQMLEDI